MAITQDTVQKIARQAKLLFSDDELTALTREFDAIFDYIAKIKDCDVTGISALHHLEGYQEEVLQEDEMHDYKIEREAYLKNASHHRSKNGYIYTS